VALAFAPPCFGAAALLAALADGAVLLVDCGSGRSLCVATVRPPKPASSGAATLLLPLPGASLPRCVLASPGRSAVVALELSDAVAHLRGGAAADARAPQQPQPLRTEHKRPVSAAAAHPGAPVVYVGYADGAVRGYAADAPSGGGASLPGASGGSAVRAATRVDRADAAAPPGRGAAPAVVALCVLPHGAASAYGHLLIAADASGRLAAWEASPNSGALTPLCAVSAAPPGAPAAAVRSLQALPGAHAVLARLEDRGGGAALRCFAAAPGGTLERAPAAAPALEELRSALAAAARDARAPAAAAAMRPAAAAAMPSCGSLALLMTSPDDLASPCVVILRAEEAPFSPAAGAAPCLLAAPAHLPLRHFFAGVDVPGGAGDVAADAEEASAGASPSPRRVFDVPASLFFATGDAVGRVATAPAPAASRQEELQPALELGASISHLVRSDAAASTLVFARAGPGGPPSAMAMLSDGPPARCTPMRSARDGAFFGPRDCCVALLDASGTTLALFAAPAAGGGPGAAPPLARCELPAPAAQRLFAGGAPGCAGAAVLAATHGASLRRVRLRTVVDDAAPVARCRPGLPLRPGEVVLQVAWQTLPAFAAATVGPAAAAVLTSQRLVLTDAALRPVAQHAPGPEAPPRSLLWAGPALLFSSDTHVAQLAWDGAVHVIAAVDAADAAASADTPRAAPEAAPGNNGSSSHGGANAAGDVAPGPPAADAPVLLAALHDRLLLLHPGRGPGAIEMRLRSRPIGLLHPLALGWLSLRATAAPQLRLRAALAAAAAASDAARVSPELLTALCSASGDDPSGTASVAGLALALARAPGAWLPAADAAAAALACGDPAGAFASLRAAAPPDVAAGTVLGAPQRDAAAAAALAALAAEALRRREPPLAWGAAMLAGDARGVLAAASAVASSADPSAAFAALTSLAGRLHDRALAAAAIEAMRAAAGAAQRAPPPLPHPPPPPKAWALVPAPANGAAMRAAGAAVAWLDPRRAAAGAVAGTPVPMPGLSVAPPRPANAPRAPSRASWRALSEEVAFSAAGGYGGRAGSFAPPASERSGYGGGNGRVSAPPSVAGGAGASAPPSVIASSAADSDDERPPPQPLPQSNLAPRPPAPQQQQPGGGDTSSDEDEQPMSVASRQRIVVNIRAAAPAPALPPKPLPRLPGSGPPSVRAPASVAAAPAGDAPPPPPSVARPPPASSGPVSYVGRPFDPFAAAAAAEDTGGNPFGPPPGGDGNSFGR
jgi:hypothetical protein